jgi:D-alanyl-D-alanine carboxypeptidase/D-alanyl-D-alanine-endopeptidase (penicillin-binding protein 4)
VTAYWRGKGVDVNGLHMMDGSGLSRYNGITPAQMEHMLRLNRKEPWFEAFWNSLPVAGDLQDPGTLSSMCRGTVCEKNMRAKSGYIMRVRTYTGYVKNKSGQLLTFSLMANNYTCSNATMRTQLEKLMVLIGELE